MQKMFIMRKILNIEDWISEFSLKYYEKKASDGSFIPPISSSIKPYAHQFKGRVLLEKNSSAGALLIADEVGVGKTYSVGHIVRSMLLSGMNDRILVLCPARLVKAKWIPTMRDFGLRPRESFTGKTLQKWLSGSYNRQLMISSYEKAAGSGVTLEDFESDFAEGKYKDIDLVIIDEIHNFVQSAKNRIGLAKIALNLSSARIGLTATPIWNGMNDFSEIIDLLQPNGETSESVEKDLELQGRLSKLCFSLYDQKSDIEDLKRELNQLSNDLNMEIGKDYEIQSKEGRVDLAQSLIQHSPFSSWLIRTTAREVSSSRQRKIHNPILVDLRNDSGEEYYDENTGKIESSLSEFQAYCQIRDLLKHASHKLQLDSMPSSFANHLDDIKSKLNLSSESYREIEFLSNGLKETVNKESKCKAIINQVRENIAKDDCNGVVIFTHWLPTFVKLASELEKVEKKMNMKLFACNPKLDEESLESLIHRFQSHKGDETPVVLVTDKFKEGIDLYKANYMIHVDVPTNPLLVEQRIGRIDRMGQKSDTIHIFYVLINQSREHECLEILKRRLEQFADYFGVANPILPEDIGWKGQISKGTIELIKGEDFDSMSHLSIDDKLMTKLCKEFAKNVSDPLRGTYSGLVHALFDELLQSEKTLLDDKLSYPVGKENWRGFVEKFSGGDARLKGQSGKPGVLANRVNKAERRFKIQLDGYRVPKQQDIRRRCIQLLHEGSPELPPAFIQVSDLDSDLVSIFKLSFAIGKSRFDNLYSFSIKNGVAKHLADSQWKEYLLSASKNSEFKDISSKNSQEITNIVSSELENIADRMLQRKIRSLEMKEKRLTNYLRVNQDMPLRVQNNLRRRIEDTRAQIKDSQVSNLELNLIALLGGGINVK